MKRPRIALWIKRHHPTWVDTRLWCWAVRRVDRWHAIRLTPRFLAEFVEEEVDGDFSVGTIQYTPNPNHPDNRSTTLTGKLHR